MSAARDETWPELVIFDCDGVLIDSEVIASRIEAECLREAGFAVTADEIASEFTGMASAACHRILERRHGRTLPPDFDGVLRRRLWSAFERDLRAIPGVREALHELSDVPQCVASSSDPDRLAHTLRLAGLSEWFGDRVFSASAVPRGKPAPDLFLHAAAWMGAAPAGCAVIEDSLAGVQSGVAAGMTVIGFAGGSHCTPDHAAILARAGATTVISELTRSVSALRACRPTLPTNGSSMI